jgi:ABC-type sugar transport system permease subunit
MATEAVLAPAPRARSRRPWPETWVAAAFVAPAALVVLLIVVVPLGRALWMSLFHIVLTRPGVEPFVGLDNYVEQLTSGDFWASTGRALYFTVVSTALELAFGLALALLMDQPLRFRWLLRSIIILPWALPTIVNALMWRWIDNAEYGALNALLTQVGVLGDYRVWLSDSDIAMWTVILADVWKTTPFVALLLLAGLQVIPNDLYEAASVDGANKLQQFWRITLPLLRPAILVTLIFRTLDALRVFDVFQVFFGYRLGIQPMAVYNQSTIVQDNHVGYGSAMSVAIFLIISLFVVIYVTFVRVTEE